ncbi:hypothetical protein HYH03_003858 [Edaphochlamys debaryana]|uniref:Uncharacterized protein n=1 Tax=Edaphochlamys debaryana TaxID=47281 RepID=A0A836C2T2_9CHLO|nr:hypothetical protein HYH03_003858 [Edaphochlamys debaryana]|eukprot:KAG2498100.1 hypothetical protein HYH03_003858 [Edaphochlamys debaryana]
MAGRIGRTVRRERTRKRREVFEQAVKYGLSWQYKIVNDPSATTVVATFTTATGGPPVALDVIMWLNSRREALVIKPDLVDKDESDKDERVLVKELEDMNVTRRDENEWLPG